MQLKLRGFLLLFRDSIEFFTLFVSMPLLRMSYFAYRQNKVRTYLRTEELMLKNVYIDPSENPIF